MGAPRRHSDQAGREFVALWHRLRGPKEERPRCSDERGTTSGCGCPYHEHDSWCPLRGQPPTERDGLRVGDEVMLTSGQGPGPWPVRIVGFQATSDCCMVVEWLGLAPALERRSTICRHHVTVTAKPSPDVDGRYETNRGRS